MYLAYLWGSPIYMWMDERANFWWVIPIAVIGFYGFLSLLGKLCTHKGRLALVLFFRRSLRPEFWSPWIFYLPLIPYIVYLMVRYRSLTCFTAANPCIPAGGIVGESKADILDMIPKRWLADYLVVASPSPASPSPTSPSKSPSSTSPSKSPTSPAKSKQENSSRKATANKIMAHLRKEFRRRKWKFPVITKPDMSQRGAGFRILKTWQQCETSVRESLIRNEKMIMQEYHPGPYEIGVFYMRLPERQKKTLVKNTGKNTGKNTKKKYKQN